MRVGEKATCYCGKEIRWAGKWWEHTTSSPRHPGRPVEPNSAQQFIDELRGLFQRYDVAVRQETKYIETYDDAYSYPGELILESGQFRFTIIASDLKKIVAAHDRD